MVRFKYIFLMRPPQMETKNVYINPQTITATALVCELLLKNLL